MLFATLKDYVFVVQPSREIFAIFGREFSCLRHFGNFAGINFHGLDFRGRDFRDKGQNPRKVESFFQQKFVVPF